MSVYLDTKRKKDSIQMSLVDAFLVLLQTIFYL